MLPPKQKIYKRVYDIACEELIRSDMMNRCKSAGVLCEVSPETTTIRIPFFDEIITLVIPGFTFRSSRNTNVTLVSRILLLHYLNKADGSGLANEPIPYEDIPGLRHYAVVYEKRVLRPLEKAFGNDRQSFLDAGISLGGLQREYGDASFTIQTLPRIPITFILWEGDEEFPPSMRTLFDSTVNGYLPLEDIVVIAKLGATRILKQARLLNTDEAPYDP